MSRYAWIITRDHTADEGAEEGTNMNAIGIVGPRGCTDEQEEQLKAGEGEEFRMYDDDGILYYSGRIIGDYDGFEPLDDYGMPNAGAVRIDYKNKDGIWSQL